MSEPWLGHWDGCSIQFSTWCDCLPGEPVNLAETEVGETEEGGTT